MRVALIICAAFGLTACDEDELLPFWMGKGDTKQSEMTVETIPTPSAPIMPKSLTLEDIDFNGYSKALAKFTGLKEGQSRGEAVDNVRLYFAPEQGSQIISTSQSTFERDDGAVLLFSASGLAGDSVKAEEIYLIVSGEVGSQTLAAFGSRIKCHRNPNGGGGNTTEWQAKPGP